MKTYELNNRLGIVLPERVDSNNAASLSNEIQEVFDNKKVEHIFFDASEMRYISSAGLRIVLKFRKEDKELKIINVSSDVYEIFEATGFTEFLPVEKCFKQMNIDNCVVIGRGAKGTVYRYDIDTVLKVYNDVNSIDAIKNERELAKKAFILGIPTAISFGVVKVGDKYGAVYELIDTDSFSEVLTKEKQKVEEYSKMFADMLLLIHSTDIEGHELPSAKIKYNNYWFDSLSKVADPEILDKVKVMLQEIPEPRTMLHCDYHTNNIMLQNGEPLVIDMDTLSFGHPIYDLGTVCFTYHTQLKFNPESSETFLNLDFSTIDKIWHVFIKQYLNKFDEKKSLEIINKIFCFSYLRFINHLVRRSNDPKNDLLIKSVYADFVNHLSEINSFVW